MQDSFENTEFRKGRRVALGVGINSLIHELDESDESGKKAYRAAKVLSLFRECANEIYKDSAFLVLQSINAVYILKERDKGNLKEARPNSPLIKRLVIYTNDSMVYADIDSRQEIIKMWFTNHGEKIDKLEIYSSKFQMRSRFPYKSDVELMKKSVVEHKINEQKFEPPKNPETLKPLVDKIKDEKLREAINKLIFI